MFNKKCFLTLWLTIIFFASAGIAFGQITQSQQVAIAQKAFTKRAVAIITFENLSDYPENDWVGASFAESLTTKLSKLESLDLYERRQLNNVLMASELDQQQVSEENWEKAEQIGSTLRLKGVQSVLIGSVAMMGSYENPDTSLQVNARTVQVETGEITKGEAFSVQGKFAQLFDLQTLLAQQFVSALGVKPTSEEQQKMQERETESLAAYRLYILGLQYLDEGKYSEAKAAFWEAAKPANFPAARLAWERASEQEILERERTGVRDEAMRSTLTASARELASQGAMNIYVLGMAHEFNAEYDAAIEAYRDFLKYTQNKVLRWKYQTKSHLKRGSGHPFGRRQYPPVVSDGVVYIADENALYALERQTGRLLWQTAMDNASQLAISDGTLYVSDRGKGILYALEAKRGEVIWDAELGVKLGRSSIVAGEVVYVWSNNYEWKSKNPPDNRLYALSRTDSTRLWEYGIGARIGYSRPITVSEGIVYVFSTAPPTWDEEDEYWRWADFCTLSALDGKSGALLWESDIKVAYDANSDRDGPIDYQIDYAPVVSDGVVYVVDKFSLLGWGSHLYAISGKSGEVLWRSEKSVRGALPVLSNGVVYVPGGDGVYLFDAQSGAFHGELKVGKKVEWGSIKYHITVAEGTAYVWLATWPFDEPKSIYAFSLESGTKLWEFQVEGGIGSSVSVVTGILYFTDEDGRLYAVEGKTGKLMWKQELVASALSKRYSYGTGTYSNPVVADDLIFISAENTLYAFSVSGTLATPSDLDAQIGIGRALWRKGDLQDAREMLNAVVETKPNMSAARALLAEIAERLEQKNDAIRNWLRVIEEASSLSEAHQRALQRLGQLAGLRWRFKPSPVRTFATGTLAVTKERIYFQFYGPFFILERGMGQLVAKYENGRVFSDRDSGIVYACYGDKLYAIEAATDSVRWTYNLPSNFDCNELYATAQTVLIKGSYPFLFGLPTMKTYALSAQDGKLRWKSGKNLWGLVASGGVIAYREIGADESVNAVSSQTGKRLWRYRLPRRYPEPDSDISLSFDSSPCPLAVSEEGVYISTELTRTGINVSSSVGGIIWALDRRTGKPMWKYELKRAYHKLTTSRRGIVYADGETYTLALDGKSGEIRWKRNIGDVLVTERAIYGRAATGIQAVDAQTGEVVWNFVAGKSVLPVLLSGGVLYAVSALRDDLLYALNAETGMPLWEYPTGYEHLRNTSVAVTDGVLYFQPRQGGLYALDVLRAKALLPPRPGLLAVNYLERGQYPEAIESGQQAIAQDPSDANVLNILGRAYWKTGQTGQALTAFQNVLTLEQKGDAAVSAWSGISEMAQSEIDSENFLEFCNKLASIAPEDAEFQVRLRLLLSEFYRSRDDIEAAEKEYAKTGFPKESDWLVIGPFDNTDDKGRTVAYPPETGINLSATLRQAQGRLYQGKTGAVKWQKADDGQIDGQLDFTKIFTPHEWVLAYALIDVISPDDREAQLRIGSDDGVKVWLNGQVVWTNQAPRSLRFDQDVVSITLKKGTNRLLFKVDQGGGDWGLSVRITDASGQPLEGLQYSKAR